MDEAARSTPTRIRRASGADLAALRDFFARLSPQTRYLRFFAPITPTPAVLARLCGGTGGADTMVATRGGVIIGHAMAVDRAGPLGEAMTEIGVVVTDLWQGKGVGSALIRTLIARAQARGITSLTMDVLHGNQQVLAMITSHWPTARAGHSMGCTTVHVPLPPRQQERPPPGPGAHVPAVAPAAIRRGNSRPIAVSPAASLNHRPCAPVQMRSLAVAGRLSQGL